MKAIIMIARRGLPLRGHRNEKGIPEEGLSHLGKMFPCSMYSRRSVAFYRWIGKRWRVSILYTLWHRHQCSRFIRLFPTKASREYLHVISCAKWFYWMPLSILSEDATWARSTSQVSHWVLWNFLAFGITPCSTNLDTWPRLFLF